MLKFTDTQKKMAGLALLITCGTCYGGSPEVGIPLPEHPRPDFQRADWVNLNGRWDFRFDKENLGLSNNWAEGKTEFPLAINVPFSWGSALSGVPNLANIAWYKRTVKVPETWKGKRVFLVIGASDWHTTGWFDGHKIGQYQGGYTPFEFEVSDLVKWGEEQPFVLRVDDSPHSFKLSGKQGYGDVKGIWQTLYLEARSDVAIDYLHFLPDIDNDSVTIKASLCMPAKKAMTFTLSFKPEDRAESVVTSIRAGQKEIELKIPLSKPKRWSLENPYLYEVQATLSGDGLSDTVSTYFGMRKISVLDLPGMGHPYIALNNKPIYLRLALDQSYHPDGYYTFPSDAFMKNEIQLSRSIGLNGQRIHIKVEIPRKLYWADKLGILIMADVPNSWGKPDEKMRAESEVALRGMIRRDMNHPCIFSWVTFNETWGLRSENKKYLPETQEWVASMVRLAKSLDKTRLVEDNSPCSGDHVTTDINSFHAYLSGYKWDSQLQTISDSTYPGSKWNYIGDHVQGREPLLNSECGNVWGYKDSTGDIDWSWDYHLMMDAFRRHPKICGWLYTEHHDVINEWNGYWRFDRSEKLTGLEALVPGMSLRDWHRDLYIAVGKDLCQEVSPATKVSVPLYLSCLTDRYEGRTFFLRGMIRSWDNLGKEHQSPLELNKPLIYHAWQCDNLDPVEVTLPTVPSVVIVSIWLEDLSGNIVARNFTTFAVRESAQPRQETLMRDGHKISVSRVCPQDFIKADWSLKQWNVLDGLKVNGAGKGFFEYRIAWPTGVRIEEIAEAYFKVELSSKPLLGKDIKGATKMDGDYMRGLGTLSPSRNPNSYPMTDTQQSPSAVRISIDNEFIGRFDLPDDPADHCGILSWQAQKRDGTLSEAGTYGYLVSANIPLSLLEKAAKNGSLVVRLEADDALANGIAIYGERFGRYPLDPTLECVLK